MNGMLAIDVPTCYSVAGAGSLVGLGLISLIRTEQPRMREALALYRWAFVCLAMLLAVQFSPESVRADITRLAIGFALAGVTLLAWAFRQLNGRRTPRAWGWGATLVIAATMWAVAWLGSDRAYTLCIGTLFALISLGMAVDQGWLILRSAKVTGSEFSLLVVAGGFALNWLITVWWATEVPGPYPAHRLHVPAWLLPMAGLGFALLPLAVAAVVFAIVNDRLNQQLRARALSDDLTGALSRRGLRELGERMLAMQVRQPAMVAVLMLDVDHFKAVNDRYGHLAGDEVLRHMTNTVRDHLRVDALLARYGGEEFSVLLPVRNRVEARSVAERLRMSVERSLCETRQGPVRVTVSIGVAFHDVHRSLEDDLARADACLYQAKQTGRNRVVCDNEGS
jgi:diguanylate cyclase (GGDEF)-like protein